MNSANSHYSTRSCYEKGLMEPSDVSTTPNHVILSLSKDLGRGTTVVLRLVAMRCDLSLLVPLF